VAEQSQLPAGKENTTVSFTRREPVRTLIAPLSGRAEVAPLSGRAEDRIISQQQQTQPGSWSTQKQEPCLPQKRGFYSFLDNSAEKLIQQTATVSTDNRFKTRLSDCKFQYL